MIVILFRSRLTGLAGDDYAAMDARMLERARAAPGFIDVKSYTAEDGERLTIVRWADHETLRRWRDDAGHREAQAAGRRLWYEWYQMEVAEVVRETRFERADASIPRLHVTGGAE
jgi:heme-degrading monooxygenase HmoA